MNNEPFVIEKRVGIFLSNTHKLMKATKYGYREVYKGTKQQCENYLKQITDN